MKNNIEIGDCVDVTFVNSDYILNYEVIALPTQSGDWWIIKGLERGNIIYVQTFETMQRHNK